MLALECLLLLLFYFILFYFFERKKTVGSQIVAQTQVEKGDGPNKLSTINL